MHASLRRACYKWYKLSKLLKREGANPHVFGMFHKAVVQTVLLFGCESWTMMGAMWTSLKGFHHRAARRMANVMAYRGPGGGWIYPPLEEALKKTGLCTIEHNVNKCQQQIVDYISTRPIWVHCMSASKKPRTPARNFVARPRPTHQPTRKCHYLHTYKCMVIMFTLQTIWRLKKKLVSRMNHFVLVGNNKRIAEEKIEKWTWRHRADLARVSSK